MTHPPITTFFDAERAAAYDQQFVPLAPLRDALQLILRLALSGLPPDARVLCVGVGTGIELLDLARAFPGWHFTAVEPSAPMLAICRQKVEANGLAERCMLHEGYLDTLPPQPPFDAATVLLVSHFLVQPAVRRDFFAQIATRLRLGGHLVSADIATGPSDGGFERLFAIWGRALGLTGVTAEQLVNLRAAYGRDVAVSAPGEIEQLMADAGFEPPVQCFQGILMHGWHTTRAR
ncbi:MAG: class I SAM-dependent methyltransferase [Polyangiaceae bacterium]|jgi:tRNA (cmo5U34)-methyltransferase|nr:class I SAM-dependent methyltransferase [Polyangiaceae bacterium]